MPFQASFEVEAGKNWGFYEPTGRYILDTFVRTATSGTLGISTNGDPWTTLAGNWYCNGTQGVIPTAVTSGVGPYPLVSYDLVDINQLGYVNVSPGIGVAFSIQNANNWYAVVGYDWAHSFSCNCSTCYSCCTCTYGCTTAANCGQCGGTYNNEHSLVCNTCTYGCTTGSSCTICGGGCNPYSCNCSSCNTYYYELTVLQNINGSINTLSTVSLTQDPASISLEVKNGTVSYYAYSTSISGIVTQPNGLGTLLASGTLTISGTFGTQIGMVKSPSYDTIGTTVNGFFGTGL